MSIFNTHANRYLLSNGIPLTMSIDEVFLAMLFCKYRDIIVYKCHGTENDTYNYLKEAVEEGYDGRYYMRDLLVAFALFGEKTLAKKIAQEHCWHGDPRVISRWRPDQQGINVFYEIWDNSVELFFKPLLGEFRDMIDNILNTYDFE